MQQTPFKDWSSALDGDVRTASGLWEAIGQVDQQADVEEIDTDAGWQRLQRSLATARPDPSTVAVAKVVPAKLLQLEPRPVQALKPRWRVYLFAAAAAIALLFLANTLSGLGEPGNFFINEGSEAMTVVLKDQTRVELSPASQIRFEADAQGRRATMTGAAEFSVSPDALRPFRVEAGSMEVVVVGTVFEVLAGDPAQVSVSEGHVRARGVREADWVDLYAGDLANSSDGLITTAGPSDGAERLLRFEDTALSGILTALSAAHAVQVDAPPALMSCQFTVSLENLNLEEALQTLSVLTGARVVLKGRAYSLVGGGCR